MENNIHALLYFSNLSTFVPDLPHFRLGLVWVV
jgi:hypothetical protein